MEDEYKVVITLTQHGDKVTAHAESIPTIELGENIQPVHAIAMNMLELHFGVNDLEEGESE